MHSVPTQLFKRQYPLSKTIYYAELLQDLLEQKEALATQMIKKPKALLAFVVPNVPRDRRTHSRFIAR